MTYNSANTSPNKSLDSFLVAYKMVKMVNLSPTVFVWYTDVTNGHHARTLARTRTDTHEQTDPS